MVCFIFCNIEKASQNFIRHEDLKDVWFGLIFRHIWSLKQLLFMVMWGYYPKKHYFLHLSKQKGPEIDDYTFNSLMTSLTFSALVIFKNLNLWSKGYKKHKPDHYKTLLIRSLRTIVRHKDISQVLGNFCLWLCNDITLKDINDFNFKSKAFLWLVSLSRSSSSRTWSKE